MSVIKLNTKQIIELKALAAFGEGGTLWPSKDAAKFEKLGVVELGNVDGDQTQIRINGAGSQYLAEMENPKENTDSGVDNGSGSADNGNQSGDVAGNQKPTGGSQMFQIQSNIDIPKTTRRTRTSAFPFDQLEIGQSFFVPATAERPEPAKSMASTVNGANERHSEVIEGQTVTNRKGNEVPARKPLRKFIVRPVEDGAAWGAEGQAGAAVWRVALDA